MNTLIITTPAQDSTNTDVISLDEFYKRIERRRRRVAKRMAKRFPLFALEFMHNEFPDYSQDLFEEDIFRKTRKGKPFRRPKTPLAKLGRYPEMLRMLQLYDQTKIIDYLYAAQQMRNRIWLPFVITLTFAKKQVFFHLPATTNITFVKRLTSELSQCKNIEEAKAMYKEKVDLHFRY